MLCAEIRFLEAHQHELVDPSAVMSITVMKSHQNNNHDLMCLRC